MKRASRRLTSVAAALAVTLFAAAPAAASTTLLKLDRPGNAIASASAIQAMTVYDFFWSPYDPPPFFVGMHSYLIMPGYDWAAGSPVDDGMLAAVVRRGACQPGARYERAQLMIGERIHHMRDVLVTGCRPTGRNEAELMTLAFATVD